MPIYISREQRIKQAREIHGDKYDYSFWPETLVLTTKIESICPNHGRFTQTLKNHINKKYGCRACGREKAKETWMETLGVDNPSKAKEVEEKKQKTSLKNFGVKHPRQNKAVVEAAKATCRKKYGGDAPICSPEIREKMRETNKDRYGDEYPQRLLATKDKAKQTNLDRYGVEYPQQSPVIRATTRRNNLEKYDVEYPLQLPEIRERIRKTNLEKYGVECTLQSPEVRKRIYETNIKRYGVKTPQENSDIREKTRATNLDRYGVEYPAQSHIPQDVLSKLKDKHWLTEQHHKHKKPFLQIAQELGILYLYILTWVKKHDIAVKHFYQSIGEKEVAKFIQSLDIEIQTNRRDIIPPYELDIYLPEYRMAIEYNGEYWHSFPERIERDRTKLRLCEENNIILIIILESQWKHQQDGIKEILKDILL